jgi:hypothetical protein
MRLSYRDSGISLARRPEQRQFVHDAAGFRRIETRESVPSRPGIVSGDIDIRVLVGMGMRDTIEWVEKLVLTVFSQNGGTGGMTSEAGIPPASKPGQI